MQKTVFILVFLVLIVFASATDENGIEEWTSLETTVLILMLGMPFLIGVLLMYFLINVKRNKNKEHGDKFEEYICNLLDNKQWEILEWTRDNYKNKSRFIKKDIEPPDFKIRNRDNNNVYWLECKYQKDFYGEERGGHIFWAKGHQIERYNQYAQENPCLVVIGIGNKPEEPEHLYLVPLQKLKFSKVFREYLDRFERKTNEQFRTNEFINKLRFIIQQPLRSQEIKTYLDEGIISLTKAKVGTHSNFKAEIIAKEKLNVLKSGRKIKLENIQIKDGSGRMTLKLWEDDINKHNLQVGEKIFIRNGYINSSNTEKWITLEKNKSTEIIKLK